MVAQKEIYEKQHTVLSAYRIRLDGGGDGNGCLVDCIIHIYMGWQARRQGQSAQIQLSETIPIRLFFFVSLDAGATAIMTAAAKPVLKVELFLGILPSISINRKQ